MKRRVLLGAAIVALFSSGVIIAAAASGDTQDVSNFAPAPEALQPFCDTMPCMFVPTEDFGPTTGRELLAEATPASDCPDAKSAYEAAGHKIGGFYGPCPTAEQLQDIEPVDLDLYSEMAHTLGDFARAQASK